MPLRSCFAALPPSKGVVALSPTVVPTQSGVLVVQVQPLSVVLSFRKERNGVDLASVEVTLSQWSLLVEDCDVAILASRLGLLGSPAGVQ